MCNYTDFDQIMMDSDRLIEQGLTLCAEADLISHALDCLQHEIDKLGQDIEDARVERAAYSSLLWQHIDFSEDF
jgi:hypothetical protein